MKSWRKTVIAKVLPTAAISPAANWQPLLPRLECWRLGSRVYPGRCDGLPPIVYYNYYDPINDIGELKVAHCNDLACTSASHVTVDSAGDVGVNLSSAIGVDGLPVISYLVKRPDYDLKVAHCLDARSSANIKSRTATGWLGFLPHRY